MKKPTFEQALIIVLVAYVVVIHVFRANQDVVVEASEEVYEKYLIEQYNKLEQQKDSALKAAANERQLRLQEERNYAKLLQASGVYSAAVDSAVQNNDRRVLDSLVNALKRSI